MAETDCALEIETKPRVVTPSSSSPDSSADESEVKGPGIHARSSLVLQRRRPLKKRIRDLYRLEKLFQGDGFDGNHDGKVPSPPVFARQYASVFISTPYHQALIEESTNSEHIIAAPVKLPSVTITDANKNEPLAKNIREGLTSVCYSPTSGTTVVRVPVTKKAGDNEAGADFDAVELLGRRNHKNLYPSIDKGEDIISDGLVEDIFLRSPGPVKKQRIRSLTCQSKSDDNDSPDTSGVDPNLEDTIGKSDTNDLKDPSPEPSLCDEKESSEERIMPPPNGRPASKHSSLSKMYSLTPSRVSMKDLMEIINIPSSQYSSGHLDDLDKKMPAVQEREDILFVPPAKLPPKADPAPLSGQYAVATPYASLKPPLKSEEELDDRKPEASPTKPPPGPWHQSIADRVNRNKFHPYHRHRAQLLNRQPSSGDDGMTPLLTKSSKDFLPDKSSQELPSEVVFARCPSFCTNGSDVTSPTTLAPSSKVQSNPEHRRIADFNALSRSDSKFHNFRRAGSITHREFRPEQW